MDVCSFCLNVLWGHIFCSKYARNYVTKNIIFQREKVRDQHEIYIQVRFYLPRNYYAIKSQAADNHKRKLLDMKT